MNLNPFSPIMYTATNDENVTAAFMVDPAILLIANDEIAYKMYNINHNLVREIAAQVDIKKIDIFRKPIDTEAPLETNLLGTPIDSKKTFVDSSDNVVVRLMNKSQSGLAPSTRFLVKNNVEVNVDFDKLPESNPNLNFLDLQNLTKENLRDAKKTGSIKQVVFNKTDVMLINFTDFGIKELKGREYQYSMAITFHSKAFDYIKNIILEMKASLKQIEDYYNNINANNYDYASDKFKESFINDIHILYGFDSDISQGDFTMSEAMKNAPWIRGTYNYFATADLLSADIGKPMDIINALSPRTATVISISSIIKKQRQMIQNVLSYYNIEEQHLYLETKTNRITTRSAGMPKTNYIVEKHFHRTYNSKTLNNNGYKYFEFHDNEIASITKENYKLRAEAEIDKFFSSTPRTFDAENNRYPQEYQQKMLNINDTIYSFFTPHVVSLGAQEKIMGQSNMSFDISFFNNFNLKKEQQETDEVQPKNNVDLERKAALRGGFNFRPSKKRKQVGTQVVDNEKYRDASKYLGKHSDFLDSEGIVNKEKTKQEQFELEQNTNMISSFINDKNRTFGRIPSIGDFREMPSNFKKIDKIPVQIKSLFLNNSNSSKAKFENFDPFASPITRESMRVNYTKIVYIEYFDGFHKRNNLNILNMPRWIEVDKNWFNALGATNYYCRIRPYTNNFFDITDIQKDFKNYNTIFILNGES